jgi:hypothetical protein
LILIFDEGAQWLGARWEESSQDNQGTAPLPESTLLL